MSTSEEVRGQLYGAAEKIQTALDGNMAGFGEAGEAAEYLKLAQIRFSEGLGYLALVEEKLSSAAGSYAPASATASEASDEVRKALEGHVNLQGADLVIRQAALAADVIGDANHSSTALNTVVRSNRAGIAPLIKVIGDINDQIAASRQDMGPIHDKMAQIPAKTTDIADRL